MLLLLLADKTVEIRSGLLKFQEKPGNRHITLKLSRKLMLTLFPKPNVSGLQQGLPRRIGLLKKYLERLRPCLIKKRKACKELFFPSSAFCFLPTSLYPSVPVVCVTPVSKFRGLQIICIMCLYPCFMFYPCTFSTISSAQRKIDTTILTDPPFTTKIRYCLLFLRLPQAASV